jgi:triacylglycerol esterase/lipase EstA (alpha/beta hydrolase family)
MLSRIVLAGLVLELLAYAAIGAGLHARGWGWPTLLAGAIGVALAARLLLVCTTLALAWHFRSPRKPLGFGGSLRLLLLEWRALLADNLLYLPFERLVVRADRRCAQQATAVLLVHGYFSNRGYFRSLARALDDASGRLVCTQNFSGTFATIERFASELHREIEAVARASGRERVILVCHSMGGLAAREYLRVHGAARVERLITIASPHHGTAVAMLGMGANAAQMARGSAFLARLEEAEGSAGPGVPALSIYSRHDNLVAPQDTSRLPWARNVALAGYGHVSILGAAEVRALVIEEVRAA